MLFFSFREVVENFSRGVGREYIIICTYLLYLLRLSSCIFPLSNLCIVIPNVRALNCGSTTPKKAKKKKKKEKDNATQKTMARDETEYGHQRSKQKKTPGSQIAD